MNDSAAILWWPQISECAFQVVQSGLGMFSFGMTAVNCFNRCLGTAGIERNGSGEKLLDSTQGMVLPSSNFFRKEKSTEHQDRFFQVAIF